MKSLYKITFMYFVTLLALVMGGCSKLKNTSEIISINLAHWMKNLEPHLKDIPLMNMAIPGSHNSMTYNIFVTNTLGPDAEFILKLVSKVADEKMVLWARNQKLNTTEQLLAGIRFLDLRVAKDTETDKFYFTHGFYAGEVTEPLNEVKEFVDTHPEEVVILYFQHFYDFTDYDDHKKFMEKLLNLFGTRLIPIPMTKLEDLTINKVAKVNKSIIIVYNDPGRIYYPIWPYDMLTAPWPNKQSTKDLLEFLQTAERPPRQLFVHQAIMTPTFLFLTTRIYSNLREECAKPVLSDVVPKLGEKLQFPINVVIADFIDLENNLFPKTIIALNYKYK